MPGNTAKRGHESLSVFSANLIYIAVLSAITLLIFVVGFFFLVIVPMQRTMLQRDISRALEYSKTAFSVINNAVSTTAPTSGLHDKSDKVHDKMDVDVSEKSSEQVSGYAKVLKDENGQNTTNTSLRNKAITVSLTIFGSVAVGFTIIYYVLKYYNWTFQPKIGYVIVTVCVTAFIIALSEFTFGFTVIKPTIIVDKHRVARSLYQSAVWFARS